MKNWNKKLSAIQEVGIIPVIKIDNPSTASNLARALIRGGINTIEVTVRNDHAFQAIHTIKQEQPSMLVGAGTITNPQLAQLAKNSGADYIVSPGFDRETVLWCQKEDIPIIPGCVTPTEIQEAANLGLQIVKFFPAGKYGGVSAIKDLAGPFPNMKFIPTGGITIDELGTYLNCPAVAAVGGSFMAKSDIIAQEDWDAITLNCQACLDRVLGFELAHIGVNCNNQTDAVAQAEEMNKRFPLGVKIGNKSTFLASAVEFMHTNYYGTKGHIGFKTNSPERAKAYFEKHGFQIIPETIAYDAQGNIKFFYLFDEIGGFALHVIRK